MPLDGELFAGRKKFQRAVSIVRRQDRSDGWTEISYVLFDAPKHQGTFEERLHELEKLIRDRAAEHLRVFARMSTSHAPASITS